MSSTIESEFELPPPGPENDYGYEGDHREIVKTLGRMTVFIVGNQPPHEANKKLEEYLSDPEKEPLDGSEVAAVLDTVPAIAHHSAEWKSDRERIEAGLYFWFGFTALKTDKVDTQSVFGILDERLNRERFGAHVMKLRRGLGLKPGRD